MNAIVSSDKLPGGRRIDHYLTIPLCTLPVFPKNTASGHQENFSRQRDSPAGIKLARRNVLPVDIWPAEIHLVFRQEKQNEAIFDR
ncbi:hypothetical protein [Burkholderia sp. F1]|uniref:hypothetical protein n=1 Tax=Burkholderia sp. F1 TaxID=3366817 RepID=UPI003D712EC9